MSNSQFEMCSIRARDDQAKALIFETIENWGGAIPRNNMLLETMPDDDIIACIDYLKADVLYIPLYAGTDRCGKRTDGLEFLAKLIDQRPEYQHIPVIMPVCKYKASMLNFANGVTDVSAYKQILILHDHDIKNGALEVRIMEHLMRFAVINDGKASLA